MNPFSNLDTKGIEQQKDSLGGFSLLDTDVYTGNIKLVYAGKSAGGAHNITFHIDINGNDYRETIYLTNKKGENSYFKGDKEFLLPGFVTANNICQLTLGQNLKDLVVEERVAKLYNFEAKEEQNTKIHAFVDLHGKQITLAIFKQLEDKNILDSSGKYVPSGETRETNVIDTVFNTESGRTFNEVTNKILTGEFQVKWLEKNKGNIKNKSKGAPAVGTKSIAGQAARTTSMFSND